MSISVKPVTLWRKEVNDRPGELAATLRPLAAAGVDLQVVMGYRYPGNPARAAIELYPIAGKKAAAAAQALGLSASPMLALLVQGDNKAGTGHATAQALAAVGINVDFLVAQVVGRKYSAVIGFANPADAKAAAVLIKRALARKKK